MRKVYLWSVGYKRYSWSSDNERNTLNIAAATFQQASDGAHRWLNKQRLREAVILSVERTDIETVVEK